MSDLFNAPTNKTAISRILKLKSPLPEYVTVVDEKGVESLKPATIELSFPTDYVPDKTRLDKLKGSKETYKRIVELGLTVRVPRAIPDLDTRETKQFVRRELARSEMLTPTVSLPDGLTEHLPVYRASYFCSKYDKSLYSQVLYCTITGNYHGWDDGTFKEYDETIRTVAFGNGSKEGQLQRLRVMKDVRHGLNGKRRPRTLGELKITPEQFARMLERTMPISGPKTGAMPLNGLMTSFLQPEELEEPPWNGDYIPPVNLDGAAGVPYVGKKKRDVFTEALVLADLFLKELSAAIKTGGKKAHQEVYQKFWYFGLYCAIPKGERYAQKKWFTNTRNVMGSTFPVHLLGNQLLQPIMKNSLYNATNFDTPSLQKFTPFGGNLDLILRKVRKAVGKHEVFIYADNIYFAWWDPGTKNHHWYSFDLEKSEANATPSTISAVSYYFLTRGWVDDDGSPMFNATWTSVGISYLPAFLIDSSILIDNVQVKLDGQGSGSPFTFVANHAQSTLIYFSWLAGGTPRPGTPEFEKVLDITGIGGEVERTVLNLEDTMDRIIEESPTSGFMQSDTEPDMESDVTFNYLEELDLDLLGWSAVYSRKLGLWIPTLQKDRFFQSAGFPRRMEKKELRGHTIAEKAYDVIRYEALLYVGGFSRGPFAQALVNMSTSKRKGIKERFKPDADQVFANWTTFTELSNDDDPYLKGVDMTVPFNETQIMLLNTPITTRIHGKPRAVRLDPSKIQSELGVYQQIDSLKAPELVLSWMKSDLQDSLHVYKQALLKESSAPFKEGDDLAEKHEELMDYFRQVDWSLEMETNPESARVTLARSYTRNSRELLTIRDELLTSMSSVKTNKYVHDPVNFNDYVAKYKVYFDHSAEGYGQHPPVGSFAQATGEAPTFRITHPEADVVGPSGMVIKPLNKTLLPGRQMTSKPTNRNQKANARRREKVKALTKRDADMRDD